MWLNGFVYFPRVLISAWLAYRYVVMIFQKRDENLEYLLEVVQPDIVCALSSLNSSWTTFCEFTIMLHRKGCDLKYFGVLVKVCLVCILQYHLFCPSFLAHTIWRPLPFDNIPLCAISLVCYQHSKFSELWSCLFFQFSPFYFRGFFKVFFTSIVFSAAVSWATVLEQILVWHCFMLISPNENYLWDQLVAELCPKPSCLPSGSILHKSAVSWSSTWLKSLLISPTWIFPS